MVQLLVIYSNIIFNTGLVFTSQTSVQSIVAQVNNIGTFNIVISGSHYNVIRNI